MLTVSVNLKAVIERQPYIVIFAPLGEKESPIKLTLDSCLWMIGAREPGGNP